MTRQRLALVTNRYWPLVGADEYTLRRLIRGFRSRGICCTVVTAQWDKSWPRHMYDGTTRVIRLPRFGRHGWARIRYLRAISRWLRDHREQYDLVMVSGMRHEAHAVITGMDLSRIPLIVRVTAGGTIGDCHWQATHRLGTRIARRCHSANALIATDASIQRELLDAGYPADRIHTIPIAVRITSPRSEERRKLARRSLSSAHDILTLPAEAPFVVFADYLHESLGITTLLDAWEQVLARWPEARLWLVGEGPHGRVIWDRVRQLKLQGSVVLPGSFDDLTDIFHAADLFVMPSHDNASSNTLVEAMAAGIPVVASDTRQHRQFMTQDQQDSLVPVQNATALAESIIRNLDKPRAPSPPAEQARQRISAEHSLDACVDLHIQLFQQLLKRT